MEEPGTESKTNFYLSLLGGLGAILIFALILFIAYLPNRPPPVDEEVGQERRRKAEERTAAGIKKISEYDVVDEEEKIVRIPIEEAMELTVREYRNNAAEGEASNDG
ncbi:MAG: hypothetical protein ACLFUF_02775 [Opitutales bacterium]